MEIPSLSIQDGCIYCWACVEICPEVFSIDEDCKIIFGADLEFFQEQVQQAAEVCPVNVIQLSC